MIRPFVPLAEKLGEVFGALAGRLPGRLDVEFRGEIGDVDDRNAITLRSDEHAVAGTRVGPRAEHRIVTIDDHCVDVPPADHMLVVRNADVPGMIGLVGTVLGDAQVNVDDMAVGHHRSADTAVMVLATDGPVPPDVLDDLRSRDGILRVHALDLH